MGLSPQIIRQFAKWEILSHVRRVRQKCAKVTVSLVHCNRCSELSTKIRVTDSSVEHAE